MPVAKISCSTPSTIPFYKGKPNHRNKPEFMKNRKTIFTMILFALGSFALFPMAQAVVPPPDGGYPGGNTAEGQSALLSLTSGTFNTAVGVFSLLSNTEGNFNTAIGAGALLVNTADTGDNTAIGAGALLSNTFGSSNTANGAFALFSNTEGSTNTAVGDTALFSNTTGGENTATGFLALSSNTTGTSNTATGEGALSSNTSSGNNTAVGADALRNNSTGSTNTATGAEALLSNTIASSNTAIGHRALANNTTNSLNTAVGAGALAENTGFNNIALGAGAGANLTTGDSNIYIGNTGVDGDSNTLRIGSEGAQTRTLIAGVNSAVVSGGAVFVNGAGQLGIEISSARFKDEIRPMDKASEAILALRPVTFRYKSEIDPDRTSQFGLLAEEVEKVNPDLIIRDRDGRPHTVRYEQINAMLLNEFLKEHKKVEDQQNRIEKQGAIIAELKSKVARQQKSFVAQQQQIEALASGLQKVSAQIELNKSATKVVLNP
jgi:Chaperone of endosialidase